MTTITAPSFHIARHRRQRDPLFFMSFEKCAVMMFSFVFLYTAVTAYVLASTYYQRPLFAVIVERLMAWYDIIVTLVTQV